MKLQTALYSTGCVVTVTDPYYGSYVGIIEGPVGLIAINRMKIRVLACTEYPSQISIYNGNAVTRTPYKFGSVENFDIESMEDYFGAMPDYMESVKVALVDAIDKSAGIEKFQLKTHLKVLEVKK